MSEFTVHTPDSAPEQSQPVLRQAQKTYGMLPNLYGVFAESPAALLAYTQVSELFQQKTSLNPVEQQVVLLTAAAENRCTYCVAVHTAIAGMASVPAAVVEAIRGGTQIEDEHLEALRRFTQAVVRERGFVAGDELDAFLRAGYSQRQVLDVLVGVMLKTLSNYTNHIADTPLDAAFAKHAWQSPS